MNRKNIIILTGILIIVVSLVFYSKNSGQLQGLFVVADVNAKNTVFQTADGKFDVSITKGKFMAMIAGALMTPGDRRNVGGLKNCVPAAKGYQYEAYINFACSQKWGSSVGIKDIVTKKDAAEILAAAFGIRSSILEISGPNDKLAQSEAKNWIKTAWKYRKY